MIRRFTFPTFRPVVLVAATLAMAMPLPAAGPLPGALEMFSTETNAKAWTVYDFFNGELYYADWVAGSDPFVSLEHVGDWPLWFFANDTVAQGAFTGNYGAAGILGIAVDFFIDDGFKTLDCVVYTTGPVGRGYYYTGSVWGSDFPGGGWQFASFWFDEPWYYWDEVASDWVGFLPDAAFLAGIEEIGFDFYPVIGNTLPTVAAIDNVALIPTVVAPRLASSVTGNLFTITFTPAPGVECDLQRYQPGLQDPWPVVAGQAGITGPALHQFQLPISAPSALFRVEAREHFTPVVSGP